MKSRLLEWLSTYNSPRTVKAYRWGVTAFVRHIYGDGSVEELAEQYLDDTDRDHAEDLTGFFVAIKDMAPKSQSLMLAAVRVFLSEYGIELPQKFWRRFQRRRKQPSRAIHMSRVPNNAELRRIVSHMPLHGSALFRLMATSGARIGEVLQLRLEDVVLKGDIAPHVTFRAESTKTGLDRPGFMTEESRAELERWLRERDGYLTTAAKKCRPRPQYKRPFEGKNLDDDRLFPFDTTTAYSMFRAALRKAGLDQRDARTGRYSVHPHVLRKWFRTRLGAVMQLDVVEALLGHEGYLTREYRKYTVRELSEFYLEAQEVLLLDVDVSVDRLNSKITEQAEQLKVVTIEQAARIAEQSQRIQKLESALKLLSDEISELLGGRQE